MVSLNWIKGPLLKWSPDCFVGPKHFEHLGTEVYRGELIVKSAIGNGREQEWEVRGWEADTEGTIDILNGEKGCSGRITSAGPN